jgi:predicted dehydrogenase
MKHSTIDRRFFLKASSLMGAGLLLNANNTASVFANAVQSAYKPLDTVKIGIVGVGGRGTYLLNVLMSLKGHQVKAVCDIIPERAEHAQKIVEDHGYPKPTAYTTGERDFERLCETEELDLVLTTTPVDWHVPVCVAAMKNGKHAATEVHATYKMEECWELVETAEKTKRQCALLENYCYDYFVMMILKMVRSGLLGELIHAESGYQHDVRNVRFGSDGKLLWRAKDMLDHNGNLYPTHAVGPVAQWMNINRGDRFDYLVSMCSKSRGMNVYAEEHFGKDHPSATQAYMQGDMSSTLIRTVNGLTITLYYDAQLPRPFDMIYRAQGTKGIIMGTSQKIYIEGKSPNDQWESINKYHEEYEHPLWKKLGQEATRYGHGGADYIMMYRLVKSLRKGKPFEIDVYDAATWSAISPLTEKSVANRSKTIDFPDFTRGKWKTNAPVGIIEA